MKSTNFCSILLMAVLLNFLNCNKILGQSIATITNIRDSSVLIKKESSRKFRRASLNDSLDRNDLILADGDNGQVEISCLNNTVKTIPPGVPYSIGTLCRAQSLSSSLRSDLLLPPLPIDTPSGDRIGAGNH